MVTIIQTKLSSNPEGKPYVSLKLQGDVELVQSSSGRFYATSNTCWVNSTFDLAMAEKLVGKVLPGTVAKVPSEAYQYKNESTGEVLILHHKYEYQPEPKDPIQGQTEAFVEEFEIPEVV